MRRLLILSFVVLLLSACGGGAATPDPAEVARLVDEAVQATVAVMPTPEPRVVEVEKVVKETVIVEKPVEVTVVKEIIVTSTPKPEPTETPTPEPSSVGRQDNPVPLGQLVDYAKNELYNFHLGVLRVIRGEEAYNIVNPPDAMFHDKPKEGNEFFLVEFRYDYLSGPDGKAGTISKMDFHLIVDNKFHSAALLVMDNQVGPSLLPGGSHTGWIPFIVPIGSDVTLLGFNQDMFGGGGGIWFSMQ